MAQYTIAYDTNLKKCFLLDRIYDTREEAISAEKIAWEQAKLSFPEEELDSSGAFLIKADFEIYEPAFKNNVVNFYIIKTLYFMEEILLN